jgi:ABC-type glycerol-3-phosphate transport system permease component
MAVATADRSATTHGGTSRRAGERLLLGLAVLIWLAVVLTPISYTIIQTFKTQEDALASNPWSLANPTLDNCCATWPTR